MDSLHEHMIFEEELMPLIRDRLATGQKVSGIPFRGVSMMPMLRQGKDTVEIAALPDKLKKYDLPIYRYPSGRYVMHRVVKVKEDHYICLGDNTIPYEKITHDQMIAVVTAFSRGGKRVPVDNAMYRLYTWVWVNFRFVRRSKHFVKRSVKNFLRRLLK